MATKKNNTILQKTKLTTVLALDTEMVGTGANGIREDAAAVVALVNSRCEIVYKTYVKPPKKVTDYRPDFTGLKPGDLDDGEEFKIVHKTVKELIKGRILVGHSVDHDLQVLRISHDEIRDTAYYTPYKNLNKGRSAKLNFLAKQVLGISIQNGVHDCVEDAMAAMKLYLRHAKSWEAMERNRKKQREQAQERFEEYYYESDCDYY